MQSRSIAALMLFFALCRPVFGQYLDLQQNLDGCLARSEYGTCKYTLTYFSSKLTPEQLQQVEAKIKAIQAGVAKTTPRPSLNAQSSGPTQSPSPYDDLEKGFKTGVDLIGTVFEVIFFLLCAWGIWALIKKLKVTTAIKAAAPAYKTIAPYDDGPMKVDISFQEVPARSAKHRLFGGDHWWRMHMNIRMSNKDWELFQRSGLTENELFSSPNVEFPEIEESFPGFGLKWMPAHRDFPNISEAEAAKEKLIRSLHIIRSRIDDMKTSKGGGPERERIEI